MNQLSLKTTSEDQGMRLDVYLAAHLADRFSRSQVKKHVEAGNIRVNDKLVVAHYHVKDGDEIKIDLLEQPDEGTRAENIPLNILYEDEDLLLVDKPAGMVVHPACGNPHHTLVNALLYHFKSLSSVGGTIRPGLVHRLDKNTSGIMLVAKNDPAHHYLARQFKNQTIERVYRVVVSGVVQHDEGFCDAAVGRAFINRKKVMVKPSGGKEAKTYFRVLKRYKKATFLEVKLHTGRTHQIRVHMAHIDHPVLGDPLYGIASPWIERQAVHALTLGFTHPRTKAKVSFETNLPEDIQNLLMHLES